jgi:hypothetical protein
MSELEKRLKTVLKALINYGVYKWRISKDNNKVTVDTNDYKIVLSASRGAVISDASDPTNKVVTPFHNDHIHHVFDKIAESW